MANFLRPYCPIKCKSNACGWGESWHPHGHARPPAPCAALSWGRERGRGHVSRRGGSAGESLRWQPARAVQGSAAPQPPEESHPSESPPDPVPKTWCHGRTRARLPTGIPSAERRPNETLRNSSDPPRGRGFLLRKSERAGLCSPHGSQSPCSGEEKCSEKREDIRPKKRGSHYILVNLGRKTLLFLLWLLLGN